MSQGWRLVNQKELYNINKDPGQTKNVASQHPDQVAKMQAFYDQWWDRTGAGFCGNYRTPCRAQGSPGCKFDQSRLDRRPHSLESGS